MNRNWEAEYEDGEYEWEINEMWVEEEAHQIWVDAFATPQFEGCDWDDCYV
jgi:hypothetical protein